ncbi:hypothetical protein JIX56_17920 [Streptomyces sp. CA-210063]|uniref:hypothetical protein n=1 Tax=Streptomyces sp. CA-210063 TaxID=2801029 RepID=UPI00214B6B4C|nr:hypothetical protein [Streptomyces sp. CA-210063]UUU31636.1 hypothetical protein JIX56_17920 [Streptomyces sp. CA-210063]
MIITLAILGAIIAPVVWFFMWFHDVVTRDDPPPFKAGAVVELTKRPTPFDGSVNPGDHERPHGKNEPFGMNDVKDDIYEDFYPKLGDADAKVAIDCGNATLNHGVFECVASHEGHESLKVPYEVTISGFHKDAYPLLPGASTRLASWEQEVIPVKAPLFRDAVHQRIWRQAHNSEDDKAPRAACDPMPEMSLLDTGTVTKYRCYCTSKTSLKREWSTYQVTLDESGDVYLDPVSEDEARASAMATEPRSLPR